MSPRQGRLPHNLPHTHTVALIISLTLSPPPSSLSLSLSLSPSLFRSRSLPLPLSLSADVATQHVTLTELRRGVTSSAGSAATAAAAAAAAADDATSAGRVDDKTAGVTAGPSTRGASRVARISFEPSIASWTQVGHLSARPHQSWYYTSICTNNQHKTFLYDSTAVAFNHQTGLVINVWNPQRARTSKIWVSTRSTGRWSIHNKGAGDEDGGGPSAARGADDPPPSRSHPPRVLMPPPPNGAIRSLWVSGRDVAPIRSLLLAAHEAYRRRTSRTIGIYSPNEAGREGRRERESRERESMRKQPQPYGGFKGNRVPNSTAYWHESQRR